ncbi:MAG TPA: EAL domain-containing protein [Synechococcus sp. M44_DOE_062]|nr:EAL domain-containing protein [Synechococcus sp. M44_DOE_062]
MPCSNCAALPDPLQGSGRLFLWLPILHTRSKVLQALATEPQLFIPTQVQPLEDLGLVISIPEGTLRRTLEQIAGLLSTEEMRSSRALFLEGDADPRWQDCGRVESLLQVLHRARAELLIQVLAENRLTAYFQPIVSARDPSQVVAHEALMRGIDADGKLISPGLLLDMAREARLLCPLDLSARRTAIEAAIQHRLEGDLFINFSPTAIHDPAFCLRSTVWAISRAGIPPERVVFEVNESDRSPDIGHLQRILQFYRQAGFRMALDDLGAGYGSLNLLHQLQPDVIKLDVELIRGVDRDPYKAVIAQKLLEVAQNLGITTVAEGIETPEELRWAQEQGVNLVQGFLISPPQPAPLTSRPAG